MIGFAKTEKGENNYGFFNYCHSCFYNFNLYTSERNGLMKETETLSYSLLVQLYEQVKEMEDETMKYLMLLQVGTDELTRQMNY